MKKTILILFALISFAGYSQDFTNLKVKNKLTVVNEVELSDSSAIAISSDGDTLATMPSVRTEIGNSLTNYVDRVELVDTLNRYADTNFVQNQIHDSLSVFESSQWTDITGGISYDNNVTIGDTTKVSDISITGDIIPLDETENLVPDYVITRDTTNNKITNSKVSYVETVPMLDLIDTLELFTFDSLEITKIKINDSTYFSYDEELNFVIDSIEAMRITKDTTFINNFLKVEGGSNIGGSSLPTGNDGDILLSDGAGGAKTSSNFTFDGNTLTLEADSGVFNTFLGKEAANSITTGESNIFLGYKSGYLSTTALNNIFIGKESGRSTTSGTSNVFIGFESGYSNTTQFQNTFLGYKSGRNSISNYNTFLGYQSGYTNITGSNNVYLGRNSGYLSIGSNNIFIGNQAGYSETGSNKLYISNSSTSIPLMYGEFDNYKLKFNTDSTIIKGVTKADTIIADVIKGIVQVVKAQILYTNTTQTTIIILPANAIIWDISIEIDITFNDTGNDFLDIGVTSDQDKIYTVDNTYMAAINFSTVETNYKTTGESITFKYIGSNSDATQGQAFVYVKYTTF